MASLKQRKELSKGDVGSLQEPISTEFAAQHKNHRSGKDRMVPTFSLGGPHPAPRDGARRKSPKIQTNTQGSASARMELAGRK
jgi:hypothetical protein